MTAQLIKDFAAELKTTLPTATVRPALGKEFTFPAVVYSVRNGFRDVYYKGSYGLRTTEFTVTIYTKTYAELQTAKATVIGKFHGYSGTMGSSPVSRMTVSNVFDGFDDALETIYRSTILINAYD